MISTIQGRQAGRRRWRGKASRADKGSTGQSLRDAEEEGWLEGLGGDKRRVCACVKGRFGIPGKSAPN